MSSDDASEIAADFASATSSEDFLCMVTKYGAWRTNAAATEDDFSKWEMFIAAIVGTSDTGPLLRLIEAGAGVNDVIMGNMTLFMAAVTRSNAPLVDMLLQLGADPNFSIYGMPSAVHMAMKVADDDFDDRTHGVIIRTLLAGGADFNLLDWEDKTPIYVGLKERSLACLREIFRLGVRVPAEQEGDVVVAGVYCYDGPVFDELLGTGISVDAVDRYGRSPVVCAWKLAHDVANQGRPLSFECCDKLAYAGASFYKLNAPPSMLDAANRRLADLEKLVLQEDADPDGAPREARYIRRAKDWLQAKRGTVAPACALCGEEIGKQRGASAGGNAARAAWAAAGGVGQAPQWDALGPQWLILRAIAHRAAAEAAVEEAEAAVEDVRECIKKAVQIQREMVLRVDV